MLPRFRTYLSRTGRCWYDDQQTKAETRKAWATQQAALIDQLANAARIAVWNARPASGATHRAPPPEGTPARAIYDIAYAVALAELPARPAKDAG